MTVHVPPPASVDLDQACRFLARALPWPEGGEGYINIIWSEKKPEKGNRSGRGALAVRSTRPWAHSPGSPKNKGNAKSTPA